MHKLIIIPDVHGRSFWRKAVEENPEEEFIFLGDYLDPYTQDGVTADEAFAGLQDIVTFKESRSKQVTLLWGNHDLHYLRERLMGSRFDKNNAFRNKAFFHIHMHEFQLAAERKVAGRHYLFTHAGLGKKWLERLVPGSPEERINFLFGGPGYLTYPSFIKALSEVSYYRGGSELYGSVIWADLMEQEEPENQIPSIVQVFGHTMVPKAFNYDNRIYCLDCQECFYLDLDNGGIYSLEDNSPILKGNSLSALLHVSEKRDSTQ